MITRVNSSIPCQEMYTDGDKQVQFNSIFILSILSGFQIKEYVLMMTDLKLETVRFSISITTNLNVLDRSIEFRVYTSTGIF